MRLSKANALPPEGCVLTPGLLAVWRAAKEFELTYSEPVIWPTGAAPEQDLLLESDRLSVLASFELDELQGDPELARIAHFAARLCETLTGAVSIVEAERQLFVAGEGLDTDQTPRSTSMCAHAMLGAEVLQVTDATKDSRFADFASVTSDRHLRFYAGAPLISSEGAPIGALCVTDTEPRPEGLTSVQVEGLLVLAESVRRRIEAHRSANAATAEIAASAARLRFMLDSVPDIAWSAAAGGKFDQFNARWAKVTGLPHPKNVEDWRDAIHPDDYERSLAKFEEAVLAAEMFEDEVRIKIADGSYRWMLSRAIPSSDDPATARWFGTLTDIDERYRLSQERELLAGELAHRIKNIFSVVSGLIALRARGKPEAEAFATELGENIRALSRAQDFALRADPAGGETLADLLGVLMAPYGVGENDRVSITGDTITVGTKSSTPLGLVFHELATNSAKHGALSAAEGHVDIALSDQSADAVITWRESGGPSAKAPTEQGFGSRLMAMAIDNQLGGSMSQEWREEGLIATITIPHDRLAN